jgi:hypothetical protein
MTKRQFASVQSWLEWQISVYAGNEETSALADLTVKLLRATEGGAA